MALGTLYDGTGICLSGDERQLFTDVLGDALPFKALLHGRAPEPGCETALRAKDRVWALPDVIDFACDEMRVLLVELAAILRDGRSVGLAARYEGVVEKARSALLLVVRRPAGQA